MHVDNLKMPHIESDIFYSVLAEIGTENVKISNITTTRGKNHKYINMTINYFLSGKLNLYMVDYIGKKTYEILYDMRG